MTRLGYLPDLVLFFEFGGCLVAERAVQRRFLPMLSMMLDILPEPSGS
jgi:hypothetical protein